MAATFSREGSLLQEELLQEEEQDLVPVEVTHLYTDLVAISVSVINNNSIQVRRQRAVSCRHQVTYLEVAGVLARRGCPVDFHLHTVKTLEDDTLPASFSSNNNTSIITSRM
jgi:hypothetical protein